MSDDCVLRAFALFITSSRRCLLNCFYNYCLHALLAECRENYCDYSSILKPISADILLNAVYSYISANDRDFSVSKVICAVLANLSNTEIIIIEKCSDSTCVSRTFAPQRSVGQRSIHRVVLYYSGDSYYVCTPNIDADVFNDYYVLNMLQPSPELPNENP